MDKLISIDEAGAMLGVSSAKIRTILRSAQGREMMPIASLGGASPMPDILSPANRFYGLRGGDKCFFTEEKIALYLSDVEAYKKETEKISHEAKLADAQTRIAELEAALAKKTSCNGRGMPQFVCNLRRDGKPEEEIAEILSDKGQWCSNPQIGALLHANTEISGVTSDAMTKHAQRLLGKA